MSRPGALNAAQLEKLRHVFERAAPLSADERRALVHAECGDDDLLRGEVHSLLDAHDASHGFFETVADRVIAPALHAISSGADAALQPGTVVSHYEILAHAGGGGMGVVYKARDVRLGRTVALKFLPWYATDPAAQARLIAEARAASTLDHPHIGVVYEIDTTDARRPFIAMAWYDGETLKERLRRGPLPLTEALTLAAQLADALAAAHAAGIVHRDVKPANVLITRSGAAKLVDFGIARLMSIEAQDDLSAGTLAYMSPEQTRSDPPDARTDIWSLGVLLYEALTGGRPFTGTSDELVIEMIRAGEPVPVSRARPDVPRELSELIERTLRKNPEDRVGSAEELAAALRAWLDNDGSGVRDPAAPDTRPDAWARLAGAGRPRQLRAGATVLALIATTGIAAWLLSERMPGEPPQPRMVAVLPFENSDSHAETDHLAPAIGDEIAGMLSRLRVVTIADELSTAAYRGSRSPAAEIAGALGAAALVRGTISRAGADVRLTVELFDERHGGRTRVREYRSSPDAAFELQRRAVEAIVNELDLEVSADERALLSRAPTTDAMAYDLYLRGVAAQAGAAAASPYPDLGFRSAAGDGDGRQRIIESLRRAQSYHARARETDPTFAAAYARLALVQLALSRHDGVVARRDQARLEAEAALRFDPRQPLAREALASYWMLRNDGTRAVEELGRALVERPNAPHLHSLLGSTLRELGRWDEAIMALENASRLNPRNRSAHYQAALTYSRLRRYDEAIAHWDRVIAMDSTGDPFPQLVRAFAWLRRGNADSLDAAIARIPLEPDVRGMTTYARYTAHRVMRRDAAALALLDSARFPVSADGIVYMPVSLMRAQTLERMGDTARARVNYEAARSLLEDSVAAHPRDPGMRVALGLAYAGLQRRADALREARTVSEIVPVSESSTTSTAFMGGGLEIYVQLGEVEEALELLDLLLSTPAGREISVQLLRVDPMFDGLRADPRFAALLGRYAGG